MVKIINANKTFKSHQVLKDINLTCCEGKIYGIVGRNGSGKTVLFKCICGFYSLDSGEIWFEDKLLKKDIDLIKNAGIIIEEPAFLRNYSGYRNLEYLYRINNTPNPQYLYDVLKTVGLDPLSKKKVKNYSMGMRQRLAIAQAIMEKPQIIILDEPMNGLDKRGVDEMRELFLELKRKGMLILLASHNKDDIEILCDEVYEMDEGILQRVN